MKIINKVQNDLFGELLCFANEESQPMFWGKQLKVVLGSQNEVDIIVGLDLYCYNKEFQSRWKPEKVETIEADIYSQYQIFMNECKDMGDIIMQAIEEEGEEWAVVKRNKKDSPSYFYINPKREAEFAQMDYR